VGAQNVQNVGFRTCGGELMQIFAQVTQKFFFGGIVRIVCRYVEKVRKVSDESIKAYKQM
jgi:hypothetical protein